VALASAGEVHDRYTFEQAHGNCPWISDFDVAASCHRRANLEDLRDHIEAFIERHYNRKRLHSALEFR
jgi:hypothetical protein